MGLTRRARLTARFIPLLVVVLMAGVWFSAALSLADPKGRGKSERAKAAPGQQKKAERSQADRASGGSERAGDKGSGGSGGGNDGGGGSSQRSKPSKPKSPPAQAKSGGGSSGANAGGNSGGAGSRGTSGSAKRQAQADDGDPPGNNGTIKVDDQPFDNDPNNEPHVDCVFQIDFYGFDADASDQPGAGLGNGDQNLTATYTFTLHPPTTSPTGGDQLVSDVVDIGEDAHISGNDLDASVTVNLSDALVDSGATPQANQGYHVRLDINAEGSQGDDSKSKVFWVEPCITTQSSPPPRQSSQPPSSSEGVLPSRMRSLPPSEAPTIASEQPSVLSRRVTQPEENVSFLPFTGGDLVALMLGAGGLLAAGGGLLAIRRRRP